jgi:hypothetical protein
VKKVEPKHVAYDDFIPDDSSNLGSDFVADGSGKDKGTSDFVPDEATPAQDPGILHRVLQGFQAGGKALDYPRGAIGGPLLASAIEKLSGKKVIKPGEYLNALKPDNLSTYPSADTMLERAGVPKGPTLSDYTHIPGFGEFGMIPKDSFLDVSARGAGGAALDAVSDPLSWLSFGTSTAAKQGENSLLKGALEMPAVKQAAAVATMPSALTSNAGKKLFSWGITPIEQAGERYGKNEVADTMYKYGIKGSGNQIEERLGQTAAKLKDARDEILQQADKMGGKVERGQAFDDFTSTLDQMVRDRRLSQEEAEKILDTTIGTYLTGENPSTMLATQWKTDEYKALPQKVWEATKKDSLGQTLGKKLSNGLKTGVENAVENTTGRGAELANTNHELGQLLSVLPATSKYADMLERKPYLTHFDMAAGLGGGLFSGNPGKGASMFAAKKMLDVGRMPWVRTNVGSALRTLGEGRAAPYLDTLTMQGLKKSLKKGPEEDDNGQK